MRTLKCILVNLDDFHYINFAIEFHVHPQTNWYWADNFPLHVFGASSFTQTEKHDELAREIRDKLSIITLQPSSHIYIRYKDYVNSIILDASTLVSIRLIELFRYCREHALYIESLKREKCKCKTTNRYTCNCSFSSIEIDVNSFDGVISDLACGNFNYFDTDFVNFVVR